MSDPFEKAKVIRSGEMDNEMPSYDELTGWIQRVPITWLPGLLRQCVSTCHNKEVFRTGIVPYVQRCVDICNDPNSMLRGDA